jgi:hypothetical protein
VFGEVGASHDAISYSVIPDHTITVVSGATKTSVKTDAKGQYSITLKPGSYVLTTTPPRVGRHGNTSAKVEVLEGKRVQIDFRFNDGTRCLDRETPIATPDGELPIHALRPGDRIWTCGLDGQLTIDRVAATQIVEAPGLAVRLMLRGRGLVVAPGHALANGSLPIELSTERVHYSDGRSYDLATVSGRPYFASGTALWSTMQPSGTNVECSAGTTW